MAAKNSNITAMIDKARKYTATHLIVLSEPSIDRK